MALNNNTNQNITLLKRLFDEVCSKGNIAALDEICTTNIKLHGDSAPCCANGLNALKDLEKSYSIAFPGKKAKIEEIIPSLDNPENLITVRWSTQGTHKGDLQGIAPTNKPFTVSGISIYHFSNGKISEIHQSWDRLALLEQLGIAEQALAHRS